MRIELAEELTHQQQQYLMGWRERVFPVEGVGKEWSESDQHILAYDAGELPVAHIGIGAFVLQAGERSLAVTGVGGVVVRPEYQGRGIPAQLFEFLHEQPELERFTLFCPLRLVGYYQRHGYRHYPGTVRFLQRQKLVESTFEFMYRGFELPDAYIQIPSTPW